MCIQRMVTVFIIDMQHKISDFSAFDKKNMCPPPFFYSIVVHDASCIHTHTQVYSFSSTQFRCQNSRRIHVEDKRRRMHLRMTPTSRLSA